MAARHREVVAAACLAAYGVTIDPCETHVVPVAGDRTAAVSIVAHAPRPVELYRALFREHEELVHVTVEVRRCEERAEGDGGVAGTAAA